LGENLSRFSLARLPTPPLLPSFFVSRRAPVYSGILMTLRENPAGSNPEVATVTCKVFASRANSQVRTYFEGASLNGVTSAVVS